MAGLWDYFGGGPNPAPAPGLFDQGAPVARQNPQTGGFDQYTPPPVPSALDLLYKLSGGKDMGQAYQAYQRGEYLPALGQGAWGAGQMAGMALPALRGVGALARGVAPLAREAAGAIPAMMQDTTGAIRAFHGSPHDFLPEPGYPLGRFDPNRIGTGEGAQAYGHGMPYLAEAEDVARGYRDALGAGAAMDALDGFLRRNRGINLRPEEIADRLAGTPAAALAQDPKAIESLQKLLPNYLPNLPVAGSDLAHYRYLDDAAQRMLPGHMYEVDIHAEPRQFLNWDKPLSEQPQAVRDVMARNWIKEGTLSGGDAYRRLSLRGENADTSGALVSRPEMASRDLQAAGIPGIRYLDRGSRGAGEGTQNYAMFDPTIVEILRKYGILPPLAAGGALGFSQNQ